MSLAIFRSRREAEIAAISFGVTLGGRGGTTPPKPPPPKPPTPTSSGRGGLVPLPTANVAASLSRALLTARGVTVKPTLITPPTTPPPKPPTIPSPGFFPPPATTPGPTSPGSYYGPGATPPGPVGPTSPGSYFGPGVVPPGAVPTRSTADPRTPHPFGMVAPPTPGTFPPTVTAVPVTGGANVVATVPVPTPPPEIPPGGFVQNRLPDGFSFSQPGGSSSGGGGGAPMMTGGGDAQPQTLADNFPRDEAPSSVPIKTVAIAGGSLVAVAGLAWWIARRA